MVAISRYVKLVRAKKSAVLAACLAVPLMVFAAVLPEDRSDAMYHRYDGGDVTVTGPALLLRKNIADKLSIGGSYYADAISSASIDVVTSATPYTEHRGETSLSVDYLYQDSILSLSYTNSAESDYVADTLDFNIKQEVFGNMTTIDIGFSRSWDEVGRSDTDFNESIDRYQYRLGMTQILTKNLLTSINYEGIIDRGYLNNPYRSARVLGAAVPERYPGTHTSSAIAWSTIMALPLRAAARLDYRYYWDTWQVQAHTVEVSLSKYFTERWLVEGRYRYYTQSKASFYSDNFDQEYNFMARDKELSTFASNTVGFNVAYSVLTEDFLRLFEKGTVNFSYDFIAFAYDDFTDIRNGQAYAFDAQVTQIIFSVWY